MPKSRKSSKWEMLMGLSRPKSLLTGLCIAGGMALAASALPSWAEAAPAEFKKPNIVVIMGDDIGVWNISAYNQGMMGYRTPNIDSLAKAGALFTDFYGQQSCTAGRAAFITGQSGFRTGLLKIGMPGGKEGLSPKDPTLAELLKPPRLRDRPIRQESPRRPQ